MEVWLFRNSLFDHTRSDVIFGSGQALAVLKASRVGSAVRKVRRQYALMRSLIRMEQRAAGGTHHPDMLIRGFLSDKAWRYPDDVVRGRRWEYVSDWSAETRSSGLNSPEIHNLLRDKVAFANHLSVSGLAGSAPRHLGEVENGVMLFAAEDNESFGRVIVKPRRGAKGAGVRFFSDPESLMHAVGRGELDGSIVQEWVRQHEGLAQIFPGSLNTIRILAIRERVGSAVLLPAAAHRFGREGTGVVDNASAGGLVAQVGIDSGELSPVAARDSRGQRTLWTVHPDTREPIAGVRVPCWPEAKRLVIDLMDSIPEAVHVGWDVAVGPSGPVVIEGNSHPNPNILQLNGPFLSKNAEVSAVYRRLGMISATQYRKLAGRTR